MGNNKRVSAITSGSENPVGVRLDTRHWYKTLLSLTKHFLWTATTAKLIVNIKKQLPTLIKL